MQIPTYSESMRFVRRYENLNVFDGIDHAANGMGCVEVFVFTSVTYMLKAWGAWGAPATLIQMQILRTLRTGTENRYIFWDVCQCNSPSTDIHIMKFCTRATSLIRLGVVVVFLFFFRSYPTSSSGSVFIRNKLVARFSIPMNRHYITRPHRRQDRRKISIFQKKGNVLFECLRLNKTFQCAMNARTWNKYYTLLMPRAECEIHCGNIVAIHTSDFTHQHATIYLFAFNGFPVLSFAAFWFLFQFDF